MKTNGLIQILDNLTSGAPKVVVVMGVILAIANQLCGINAIVYYAKQIF